MNEKQKTLFIAGMLLLLFALAQQILLVQKLKKNLALARHHFQLQSFMDEGQEPLIMGINLGADQQDIVRLEARLSWATIANYMIISLGTIAIIATFLVRTKEQKDGFEDEWEEDE